MKKKLQKLKRLISIDRNVVPPARGNRILYQSTKRLPKPLKNKTLCFFAHYSEYSLVHDYVVALVNQLALSGCDVVFISSCVQPLNSVQLAKLDHSVRAKILRENFGYDFGSWKAGVDCFHEDFENYESVVFVNDSVYGVFSDLREVLNGVEELGFDVWSLTDSYERCYHLQSYFWGIKLNSRTKKFLTAFWMKNFRFYTSRDQVIKHYELKIAAIALKRFSLKVGAYFSVEKLKECVAKRENRTIIDLDKINPSQDFAYELVVYLGYPLVKRELLLKNPRNCTRIHELERYLSENYPESAGQLEDHLRSIRPI